MYIEKWLKSWCPNCDNENWVHDGNDTMDADALICWSCKTFFLLNSNLEEPPVVLEDAFYGGRPLFIVNGLKNEINLS